MKAAILSRNSNKAYAARNTKHPSILQGLLVCKKTDVQKEKLEELNLELRRVIIQRDKLLDAYQQSDCLSMDEFRERMKNLNKHKDKLEKAIENHKASEIMLKSHNEILMTLE